MGDTAPRSLCLGGELLIPLRGAIVRSPTVDQKQAPLSANTLYLNSLLNGLAYYLPPSVTVTELWRSALHWSATMDHPHSAADMLGHSDLETTLNVYTHAIPESQRRAVDKVAEICSQMVARSQRVWRIKRSTS
jgi:hypothetical protein